MVSSEGRSDTATRKGDCSVLILSSERRKVEGRKRRQEGRMALKKRVSGEYSTESGVEAPSTSNASSDGP